MAEYVEKLHDGAFVVTKSDDSNKLYAGFYHDVFDSFGNTSRIFEPIAPLDVLSIEHIINLINEAE